MRVTAFIGQGMQCGLGSPALRAEVPVLPAISLVDVGTSVVCTACLLVGLVGMLPIHATVPPEGRETNGAVPELLEVEFVSEPEPPLGTDSAAVERVLAPEIQAAPSALENPEPLQPMAEVQASPTFDEPATVKSHEAWVDPLASRSAQVSTSTGGTSSVPGQAGSETTRVVGDAVSGTAGGLSAGGSVGVITLVFGEGEGRQPAPNYPVRARNAGQQGTVWVQFKVGSDGQVSSVEVNRPCPWPLLNQEALRTVRDRYRFQPGPARFYEIPIRFELGR